MHYSSQVKISLFVIAYGTLLFSLFLAMCYPSITGYALIVFAFIIFLQILDAIKELEKEKKEGD